MLKHPDVFAFIVLKPAPFPILHLATHLSELSMRFGLHSGPVTAGVLRGDRQRFQLFGDTGKIHALVGKAGCILAWI